MPHIKIPEPERTGEDLPSYAGWLVVAAMFLATLAVLGAAIYGFIILGAPLAASQGWSSGRAGSLVSAMWLMAPLALVCALFIDRIGAWRLLVLGLVIVALAFAAVPIVSDFWQIYVLRTLMGAGKIFVLIPIPVIISQWFSKRFALAIAIAWSGGAFGGLVFAPATEMLISWAGWKLAAVALSAVLFMVASIAAVTGRYAGHYARAGIERSLDDKAEAARTARPVAGWEKIRGISVCTAGAMVLAVVSSGIATLSLLIQVPALLEAYGFSTVTAASLLGLVAAGGMAGNLIAGWALDRAKSHWTSIGTGFALAGGLLAFRQLETFPYTSLAVLAVILIGGGIGACEILWITLTKRQFGTDLYAVTYGGWSFSYQSGYAMAGAVGGAIFVATSHTGYLTAIALLFIPAVAVSLWRPHMRNEEGAVNAISAAARSDRASDR